MRAVFGLIDTDEADILGICRLRVTVEDLPTSSGGDVTQGVGRGGILMSCEGLKWGVPQGERTITRLDQAVFVPSPDSYEQVPDVQGLDQSLAAIVRPGRRARRIELKSISTSKD